MNYCIPDVTVKAEAIFTKKARDNWNFLWEQFKTSNSGSMVYDLYLSSRAIYASIALAPIWCFIFIAIMSAFAETIAWICVALMQIGLIGASVGCYLYR